MYTFLIELIRNDETIVQIYEKLNFIPVITVQCPFRLVSHVTELNIRRIFTKIVS